jgi:exosortase
MVHISNGLLVLLLWAHLAGLALAARKYAGSWALARIGSPVVLVSVLFFAEHFLGFGRLSWIFPLTTAASLWLIWRGWTHLRDQWRTELLFHGAFLYALAWRYCFPDIDASSEKITDLTFVANYLGGGTLPPVDRWLPPFRFEMYYALQHYAAALIGRILDTSAGMAYNLGFCTVVALATTAAAAAAMILVQRRLPALLLTASFLVGGVGTAPIIRFVEGSPALWSSPRFIGGSFAADSATRPMGRWLLQASGVNRDTPDLPAETFSYMIGLGDYHPPFSGFLLLMLALLCLSLIESGQAWEAAHALLGASAPLLLACNSWQFPLQMALVCGYIALRLFLRKPVAWKPLAGGFAASLLLLEPFLSHFGPVSVAASMPLRIVPAAERTPPILWLLVFYPLLVVLGLQLFCGDKSRLTAGLCVFWIVLLAFTEIFFMDDMYGGKYNRFNSALKWWAWTYSGGLLLIGALNLRARSRLCRWGTAVMLTLTCTFAGELGIHFWSTPKRHFGQLDGAAVIRDDAGEKVILDLLQHSPPAIVLQRVPTGAYTMQPALAIFAGQTAFLGWQNHENVWRGNRADIDGRKREVDAFYRGDLPDSLQWLQSNQIEYVVWGRDDNQLPPHTAAPHLRQGQRRHQRSICVARILRGRRLPRRALAGAQKMSAPSIRPRTLTLLTAAALAVCFASTIGGMVEQWTTDEDMGHGFLVPVVIAWIVWREREQWRGLPVKPGAWGFVLLFGGAALQLVSAVGVGLFAGAVGMILSIAGAIVCLGGSAWLRAWAFPLLLTLFALPKLAIVYNQATLPLQLLATRMAGGILSLAGFAVARDGNILSVAGHRIAVIEACDGLRYLLPLAFIAVVFAYSADSKRWMRLALLVSAVPLALIANALRVAAAACLPALAVGTAHAVSGWLIFVFCLPVLIFVRRLFNSVYGRLHA